MTTINAPSVLSYVKYHVDLQRKRQKKKMNKITKNKQKLFKRNSYIKTKKKIK